MGFIKEPQAYYKTALTDLQGAWGILRDVVVDEYGFNNSDKLLFHIDEAMSWESVRNLKLMKETLIIIRNLALQSPAPKNILDCINEVSLDLEEVFAAIKEGEGL